MYETLQEYLILAGKVVTFCYALPVLAGLWYYKKLSRPLKMFLLYVFVTLLLYSLEQLFIWSTRLSTYYYQLKPYLEHWKISNPMFLYILFYLKNTLLLGRLYSLLLSNHPIGIKIWWGAVTLSIVEIFSYFFIDGYQGYGKLNPTLDSIFCFGIPMLYLWFLYRNTAINITLNKNSYVWISFGLILQNLISLLFYYTADTLYETDKDTYSIAFIGRNSIEILGVIFFCIAFYQARYARFVEKQV